MGNQENMMDEAKSHIQSHRTAKVYCWPELDEVRLVKKSFIPSQKDSAVSFKQRLAGNCHEAKLDLID